MEIAGYNGERLHRTKRCGKCKESYEGYEVIDPKDFPPDQLEEQLKRYKK